jgi:hypothetical protein
MRQSTEVNGYVETKEAWGSLGRMSKWNLMPVVADVVDLYTLAKH